MKWCPGADAGPATVAERVRRRLHSVNAEPPRRTNVPSPSTSATPIADPGVDRSVDAARLRAGLARCGAIVARHAAGLTRLDAVLGDGDHGDNLVIGFRAVDDLLAGLPAETTPGDILRAVGHRLVAAVGGASGPLYGTACIEAGFVAGDAPVLDGTTVAAMLRAAADGLARRGRCRPGDKTILDTLGPATTAFAGAIEQGDDPGAAWGSAVHAGASGMRATRDLVARRGLAMRLGERSVGHRDPGAASCLLLLCALGGR
jgi:phosphoenolpyruvate---glycerone phosphotransferase subunit DhaL